MAKKELKPVRDVLDKTMLVAHSNHQLSLPFILGMRELVKIYKKEFAETVKNYIDAVEVNFMKNPNVATALISDLKGSLPGYVASPAQKEIIADFFDICEEKLFTALKNNIEDKHPNLDEFYKIGEMLVNKKQSRRLIVGIVIKEKKGKEFASYQYMDEKNQNGLCDHVSMVSWLNK